MSHTSYDIHIRLRDHWVFEDTRETELMARNAAARLLADPSCAGVRIIRNFHIGSRLVRETEIFQEIREVQDSRPERINDIDEASPLCHDADTFAGPDSRHLMGRLFRSYLNSITATPTEVMHSHRELLRMQDKGQLIWSGIGRVAELQAARAGGDGRERRAALSGFVDDLSRRAHAAAQLRLPPLEAGFGALRATLAGQDGPDTPDYLALTALSRHLLDTRSWAAKLQTLCRLITDEPDPHAVALLDGVVADVLGTDVIQELLGPQPTLGSALCGMLDLARGRFQPRAPGAQALAEPLNALFAQRRLPASRRCLILRVHRQLRSAQPLHPRDPAEERGEFHRLLPRLLTPSGLLEGAVTAEAITQRFARGVEQGGRAGRLGAVRAAFAAMPEPGHGVVYLSALSHSAEAPALMEAMLDLLGQVATIRTLPQLGQPGQPANERMAGAARAVRALAASALPTRARDSAMQHIDDLIENFVIAERILERIDQSAVHVRERAQKLVRFCGSGLLPEGKALRRARAHSLALLRQPNFNERFIEGLTDPGEAEAALRDFHHQLQSQPGFIS
jgi:hypothetical protein